MQVHVQHGGSAEFRNSFSIDDCKRGRMLAPPEGIAPGGA